MRKVLCLFSLLFLTLSLCAQKGTGKNQAAIAAGIAMPAGRFANSHGIGAEVAASSATAWIAFFKQQQVRFAWSGGAAYYSGKKETVSGYRYTYPGYAVVNAMAGAMYSPLRKTAFVFTAGPAVSFYNGGSAFNISSRLDVQYHFTKKWAVSPGVMMLKEAGAGPFWTVSLKAVLAL